eukprot:SAG31_NODE_4849_length_2906_cov_2.398290_2_plen_161_part_00
MRHDAGVRLLRPRGHRHPARAWVPRSSLPSAGRRPCVPGPCVPVVPELALRCRTRCQSHTRTGCLPECRGTCSASMIGARTWLRSGRCRHRTFRKSRGASMLTTTQSRSVVAPRVRRRQPRSRAAARSPSRSAQLLDRWQVNKLLQEGGHDLIISVGQVR